MSTTYRPPYDEDDELDLRGLYRKLPRQEASVENDGRARRAWRDYRGPRSAGQSWHPGWSVAACLSMVVILFVWTDMREGIEEPVRVVEPGNAPRMAADTQAPVPAPVAASISSSSKATASAPVALISISPAKLTPATPPVEAVLAKQAAPAETATTAEATTTTSDQAATPTEATALSEEDIDTRVAHIRQLLQDDHQDDARQALVELQQAAPDFTLPDDLEELAQKTPA